MARAVRKHDGAETNGMRPPFARPAATPTMSCSAIPTLISRSGNAFLNASSLLEPTESLTTPTMRWSASASSERVLTYASRQSKRGWSLREVAFGKVSVIGCSSGVAGVGGVREFVQGQGELVGRRHLVMPGDVVAHERDRVALVRVRDHERRFAGPE